MKKTNISTSNIKKVLSYLKPHRLLFLLSLIFAAATALLTLYLPILIGNAIDLIVKPGQVDFAGIWTLLKKMAVIIVLTSVAQWLMNLCNNTVTYRTVRDIRRAAFDRIQILPLKYIDGHAYGDVVSRVINDVDQFADGLLMGFTQLFTGIMTILGTLIFMLRLSWQIAAVVVVITPLSLQVASPEVIPLTAW